MEYTHTFEIIMDGIALEGEISFDKGENTNIKTNAPEEMTLHQHSKVQRLFELFTSISQCCENEIEKIELVKK